MFGSSLPPVISGGIMSYLRYLCLFACGGVQHIMSCVFALFLFSSCVPFDASSSGLFIFEWPFGIL